MLIGDGLKSMAGPNYDLDSVQPGEQVLVKLQGTGFDYGALPDRAFENLLIISVGRSVQWVESELRNQECDLNKIGVIPIGVSSDKYAGPLWHTETVYPSDLTGISIAFSRAYNFLKESQGWVVIDGLNILLMYVEPSRLHPLIDNIAQQSRNKNLHGIFAIDASSVEPEKLNQFAQALDKVISARQ